MDEAVVESVVSRCEELTPAECVTFLEKGYLVIKRAFPRAVAAHAVVEQAWRSLEADAGIAHRIKIGRLSCTAIFGDTVRTAHT